MSTICVRMKRCRELKRSAPWRHLEKLEIANRVARISPMTAPCHPWRSLDLEFSKISIMYYNFW